MKERPIIFSADMVRAILEGRKTQTRRVIKRDPGFINYAKEQTVLKGMWHPTSPSGKIGLVRPEKCPYGQPGDRLWVRETWQTWCEFDTVAPRDLTPGKCGLQYPATYDHWVSKKRSPIHMPRWASRIMLEVVNVRVERVQDISEDDAKAEGMPPNWLGELSGWNEHDHGFIPPHQLGDAAKDDPEPVFFTARDAYAEYWNYLNAKRGYGWDENPWVWVIEFKQVTA